MVVGVLSGRGTVSLFRVPPKVKINSVYYIDNVLKPLVETYLPQLYPGELHKVWIHYDMATSHFSKETAKYMEEAEVKYGVQFVKIRENIVKALLISLGSGLLNSSSGRDALPCCGMF